jgi:hypothetical protein
MAARHPAATATAVTTTGETKLPSRRVDDCTIPRSRPRRSSGADENTSEVTAGAPLPDASPPRPRSSTNTTQPGAVDDSRLTVPLTPAASRMRRRSVSSPVVARTNGIAVAQPNPMHSASVPSHADGTPRSAATSPTRYSGARRSKNTDPYRRNAPATVNPSRRAGTTHTLRPGTA